MRMLKTGFFLTIVFIFLAVFTNSNELYAQGKGKGNKQEVKAGGPPPWAPAHGYRAKTRYVYFKDYDVYYDHDRSVYISLAGTNWQVSANIPVNLRGIDLNAAVKIDLDTDVDDPQRDYSQHKQKYPKRK
ncbi:hypothetical protein [Fulvivirga sedimenti]|uniref:Uncharacterized protein n=1 Tax=Fulvivirga sedimenti TaxID=2879465 RepID=A0A9X1KZY8_9BACT|nr:hypothetical protein [Fulvivirga sedimenti]MCA6078845.1 hypothetical protein [Fulvivirga sedimenti]